MADELRYRERFEHCFFSCEMRLAKPDPDYFRMAATRLDLPPSQLLFIDDKSVNVAAARAVGLHSVCFAHSKDARAASTLREILLGFGVAASAPRLGAPSSD